MYPSFFNCHNCNCHRPIFYFFTFLPFLYQALECPEQFAAHADGVTLDAEIPVDLHRLEVRTKRAIVAAGDSPQRNFSCFFFDYSR